MDNKEITKLKSPLNRLANYYELWAVFCFIFLIYQQWNVMDFFSSFDGNYSDAELFKKNTGYFLINIFTSFENIFLISLSILIFSFVSDKSKYSSFILTRNIDFGDLLFYYFPLFIIIIWTLIKISFDFYSYELKMKLIIQLVTFSILSVYVRNYKNKILSVLEDQS
jgi:hypothetical protein